MSAERFPGLKKISPTSAPKNAFPEEDDVLLDPDDPNYRFQKAGNSMKEKYDRLPTGWSRNEKALGGNGSPPYIHEDGRVSWRHPNSKDILESAVKEFQDENPEADPLLEINKIKSMLRHGVPRQGIINAAKLKGVDVSLILNFVEKDLMEEKDPYSNSASEATEQKKESKLQNNANSLARIKSAATVEKLKLMIKRGVAPGAVKIAADREGVDFDLVMTDEEKNTSEVVGHRSRDELTHTKIFRACEDGSGVDFLVPQNGKEPDLLGLVRKMVLTVRKGYRGFGGEKFMKVCSQDLYNAIGSFRGVQHARDTFNTTCAASKNVDENEMRLLRKPFLEQLVALNIRPPSKRYMEVNIIGLDEFVVLIEKLHEKEIRAVEDDAKLGLCTFDSLSEMYKPGMEVVCKDAFTAGVDMLSEVAWSRYEQGRSIFGITRAFRICFHFWVSVGDHFTLCEFVEGIEQFDGHRNIHSMSFVPLNCYDSSTRTSMMDKFRFRGEVYSSCGTGKHFLEYQKGSFFAKVGNRHSSSSALLAPGRVMVDTQGCYEAGFSPSIGNLSMVEGIHYKYKEYMLQMRHEKQKLAGRNMLGAGKDGFTSQMHNTSEDGMIIFDKIPSKFIAMTWPAVVGFSFSCKSWGDILVDGISKINFDKSTFDKLVLPSARKRMIKALVRHSNTSFSDIISGKGEGSVFLLYGPPGVGKTLTAEAISEMLHRPLYSISLGQLGTSPEELEKKLSEILELCGKWNAIVLLDEADVLLEKRSANGSLERNAMVSVMLRLVEYFRGVLFLTSNRIDSLDPAFQTRITLALRYDVLDKNARVKVWTNILGSSGHAHRIENGSLDVTKLAESKLNGREIKNSIRLSMALAEEDKTDISQEIILETVETLLDFNTEMSNAEQY